MGNILAFIRQLTDSGNPELDQKYSVFLEFENEHLDFSELNGKERALAEKIERKLLSAYQMAEFLKSYGAGGRQVIKEASAKPTDLDVQNEAWNKLLPMLNSLLQLYRVTGELIEDVPEVLNNMWSQSTGRESTAIIDTMKKNMFLVIQLGKILDYVMRFDAAKMNAPSIPNDISYIKRQIHVRSQKKLPVSSDLYSEVLMMENIDSMATFYREPSPALKRIIDIVKNIFGKDTCKDEPLDLIVSFSKVCIKILDSDLRVKYQRFGTVGMILRIMVATTLLYDHLHSDGVFVKDSPINVKLVVEILEEESGTKRRRTRSRLDTPPNLKVEKTEKQNRNSFQDLQDESKNLLSVLKYSNLHLRSPTTPKSVEQIFAGIF